MWHSAFNKHKEANHWNFLCIYFLPSQQNIKNMNVYIHDQLKYNLLTKADREGISSKSRVAYTVKGPISRVSTDTLSIYTTCDKVARICTHSDEVSNRNLLS